MHLPNKELRRLPKKGVHRISVDGAIYIWFAHGTDNYHIDLWVLPGASGQKLYCHFGYGIVITPYTVRQTILYAISVGWTPETKGPDLWLGDMDDKVDLRLDQNGVEIIQASQI
jgi:hypothetical protein